MPIKFYSQEKLFSLEGKEYQYAFAVDDNLLIRHIYWGRKIEKTSDFDVSQISEISSNDPLLDVIPLECSCFGGLNFLESSIKLNFKDGNRSLMLAYDSYCISENQLIVTLRDKFYKVIVKLIYRIWEDEDIIERWCEIENHGEEYLDIEKAASAEFNMPETDYYISNTRGHWAAELQMERESISFGKKILESRKGSTGHNNSPYFIMDRNATEDGGEVFFGVLAYSGNFKITAESTPYERTKVVAGISEFDFSYRLHKNESFRTPEVYAGFTDHGFEDMSHRLNVLSLKRLMPVENRQKLRPVLYNSWEASNFSVNAKEQMELAKLAASIGAELFVVDDGWFGERNSDKAGLGDWHVNEKKFPGGLRNLIERVNSLGMDFGIWIEPEMVNPDSDLYREHPDWVYNFPNRESTTSRNQLVLNTTKKEVREYIKTSIDELLSENNIRYVKWDMNRPISEAGADNLPLEERKSMWFRNTEAFYEIIDYIRGKHKEVEFEACASGGGRIDFGALKHFDQFWTSDNTDALDRLFIQESYSYIYPIKMMRAWVTDCPNFFSHRNIPLKFRFHCAMMGALGIGGDLNKWSEDEKILAKELIEEYKIIRAVVQEGRIFRLKSIKKGDIEAVQYQNGSKGVLFVLKPLSKYGAENYNIKLKGLDNDKNYEIKLEDMRFIKSGAYLKNFGIRVELRGDFASSAILIKEYND